MFDSSLPWHYCDIPVTVWIMIQAGMYQIWLSYLASICDNTPCMNGGQCTPTSPTMFTCDCQTGFSGPQCNSEYMYEWLQVLNFVTSITDDSTCNTRQFFTCITGTTFEWKLKEYNPKLNSREWADTQQRTWNN